MQNVYHAVAIKVTATVGGVKSVLQPGEAVRLGYSRSFSVRKLSPQRWRGLKVATHVHVQMVTCAYAQNQPTCGDGLILRWEGEGAEAVPVATHPVILCPGARAHAQFETEEDAHLWTGKMGEARARLQTLFALSGVWEYNLKAPASSMESAVKSTRSVNLFEVQEAFSGLRVKAAPPVLPFLAQPDHKGGLVDVAGGGRIRLRKIEGSDLKPIHDFSRCSTSEEDVDAEVYLQVPKNGDNVFLVDCLTQPDPIPAAWTLAALELAH